MTQHSNSRTSKRTLLSTTTTIEFIAMDLIDEFHPASSKGNRYALTAICMLTGFTFCIPLKSKKAEDMVTAYLNHICCVFGPSKKILTDNGKEFKNKMWDEVFKRLKMEHRVTPAQSHKSRAAVDYTPMDVEPHGPTREVRPIVAVANDSQSHLVASSI